MYGRHGKNGAENALMAQGLDEILLGFVEEMEGYVPLIGRL